MNGFITLLDAYVRYIFRVDRLDAWIDGWLGEWTDACIN